MRYFRIFKIKAEERWAALVTLLFSVLLNGLVVWTYADKFMPVSHDHWQLFIRHFQVSGFDPITYAIITDWQTGYNVYRHFSSSAPFTVLYSSTASCGKSSS